MNLQDFMKSIRKKLEDIEDENVKEDINEIEEQVVPSVDLFIKNGKVDFNASEYERHYVNGYSDGTPTYYKDLTGYSSPIGTYETSAINISSDLDYTGNPAYDEYVKNLEKNLRIEKNKRRRCLQQNKKYNIRKRVHKN